MKNKKPPFLFDFGVSQEDPLTEIRILELQPGDTVLSLASAGDVPLSLLSVIENIRIKAVDISETQIKLCRLKLASAIHLECPENGQFLGYSAMDKEIRKELYSNKIRPHLSDDDASFWDQNITAIGNGVINSGRFERYIKKLKAVAALFIGTKNLTALINAGSLEDQKRIFDNKIATRKSLQLLFRIAFHPAIYKKRGLQEQALIHANKTTGERFYSKFRDFCTSNPGSLNYFLQYFLTGSCHSQEALPEFLQKTNSERLRKNAGMIEFETLSVQDAIISGGKGHFNKIHLSNLGDWSDKDQFISLMELIRNNCNPGILICYRYLQKNHFYSFRGEGFISDNESATLAEKSDRFPFYGILKIILNS